MSDERMKVKAEERGWCPGLLTERGTRPLEGRPHLRGLLSMGAKNLFAVNQVKFKFLPRAFHEEAGLHAMKVAHTLIMVDSGTMRQQV